MNRENCALKLVDEISLLLSFLRIKERKILESLRLFVVLQQPRKYRQQ